eukprot:evm.model.scf_648.7 EVM.evm.TU.scf_648.7   scf_648:57085-59284(+)
MASKLTLMRRLALQQARSLLYELPCFMLLELPGRPHVVYELRDYSQQDAEAGSEVARHDLPFLFRPFEVGQAPPPKERGGLEAPRDSTIHEYLNWTVTAQALVREDNLDFTGFRVIVLLPRLRPGWPAPGAYETEQPKPCEELGGPKNPLPGLLTNGKAVCAATIRCGRGYIEIPFFATKESRRGRGFGRCLLEAIEEVARVVGVSKLLLCSTDDAGTIATWRHLGFRETGDGELMGWGICWGDLLHMTNTTQMVKILDPPKRWKSLVVRHQHFAQRAYYPGAEPAPRVGWKRRIEQRDMGADEEEEEEEEKEGEGGADETDGAAGGEENGGTGEGEISPRRSKTSNTNS